MENNSESLKQHIGNGDSIEDDPKYDLNEMYVKFESNQVQTQSDTKNTSGKIGRSNIHKCDICFKSFGSRGKLECHTRTHTGERPYSCHICGKAFTENGTLKVHMQSLHSKEREFSCDQCDYATVSNYQLKTHRRIHTGDTLYQCDKCAKTFTSQSNLTTHLLIHTGEMNFQCDDCGKSFGRASVLKCHRRVHNRERPYKCKKCSGKFKSIDSLKRHKSKHRDVADFLCDRCPKTFFDPYSLKQHKHYHKNEPSECPECGNILRNKRYLADHLRNKHRQGSRHKVTTKVDCKHCGKAFRSNSELQTHMRTHTGEKPYVCDECGKAFTKSCNLNVHTLIHSGKTPFKCQTCFKGFRERFPLKKHMLKIHGIEYKCPTQPPQEQQLLKPLVSPPLPSETHFLEPSVQTLSPPAHKQFLESAPPPLETQILKPAVSTLLLSEKQFLEPHSPHISSSEIQFLEPLVPPSPPSDAQFLKPPISLNSTEKQFINPCITVPPPLEIQSLERLGLNPRSTQHWTEDEFKGLSNVEDESVAPCPTSTIPCGKESIFSKIDGNSVKKENIKTEPREFNGDEFGHKNIEVEPPKEAADIDWIKLEKDCMKCDNDDNIKIECEESDENENMKIGFTEFESDIIKMSSGVSSKNMESINITIFKEKNNYDDDKIIKNPIDDISESHAKVPSEKKPYICEICPKTYTKKWDLSYHMGSAHGDANAPIKKKSYECSECEYKCSCESNMKKHIQHVHTNERPFQCDQCPKTYKDQRGLNYHMEASHGSENTKQVTCEDCGKLFKSEDILRKHRRVYHPLNGEVKYYSCDQCEYKSRYKQNIKIHIKHTHTNERIQCEYCPNTYKTMDSLTYHLGSAHEIGSGTFTCKDCGKTCPTKMHLWAHRKRCSNLTTKPVCDKCGITLSSTASMKRHNMRPCGNRNTSGKIGESNIHKCDICFKSFRIRSALERHMRTHTGERPFNCKICGKAFVENGSLKHHMKSKHSEEREFMCDQCDYATVSNYQLKTHKIIHSDDNPYQCEKCAKTFSSQSNLNTHLVIHTGERNFHCDDCGKAFVRAFTLKVHMRVHTEKNV